jgi:hypothetical protein
VAGFEVSMPARPGQLGGSRLGVCGGVCAEGGEVLPGGSALVLGGSVLLEGGGSGAQEREQPPPFLDGSRVVTPVLPAELRDAVEPGLRGGGGGGFIAVVLNEEVLLGTALKIGIGAELADGGDLEREHVRLIQERFDAVVGSELPLAARAGKEVVVELADAAAVEVEPVEDDPHLAAALVQVVVVVGSHGVALPCGGGGRRFVVRSPSVHAAEGEL